MTNYVLTKPKLNVCDDLHNKLKKMDFDDIINNPETHFQNVYVTNFDLIHHSAGGDPLCYSKSFIINLSLQLLNLNVTMFKKKSKESLFLKKDKNLYFSRALFNLYCLGCFSISSISLFLFFCFTSWFIKYSGSLTFN